LGYLIFLETFCRIILSRSILIEVRTVTLSSIFGKRGGFGEPLLLSIPQKKATIPELGTGKLTVWDVAVLACFNVVSKPSGLLCHKLHRQIYALIEASIVA
jgi:hypothetical protein